MFKITLIMDVLMTRKTMHAGRAPILATTALIFASPTSAQKGRVSRYWRRPPDPTSAPKATGRELARAFAGFERLAVVKRHLRRSELPHPWRVLPLMLLERLIGRVLVLKAFKPLGARTGSHAPLAAAARAA